MKSLRIAFLGCGIQFSEVSRHNSFSYAESTSLLEYDIVVWNPKTILQSFFSSERYMSKYLLDTHDSTKILENISRRSTEFDELLSLGRTIIILTPPPESWYIDTGERTYSGTGRNRHATKNVSEMHIKDLMPVKNFSSMKASGDNIEFRGGNRILNKYWNAMKDFHCYDARIPSSIGNPFLYIKGTEHPVGAFANVKKGRVLLLPTLKFFSAEFETPKEDFSKQADEFIRVIIELHHELLGLTSYTLPDWTNNYKLPDEVTIETRLSELNTKLIGMKKEINKQENDIEQLRSLKLLISGSGDPLRDKVAKVLQEIGFRIIESEIVNRDDIIVEYNGRIGVIEVKGVSKSAAEKNAAQLEKWVSEYFANNDVHPKGILIVNAFCDMPLEQRTEPAFPSQMLTYSSNRGQCLLTTAQLLMMYLDFLKNPENKDVIINSIFENIGIYPNYTDFSSLKIIDDEVKTK